MKKLLLICFLLTIFFVITIGANADKYMWNAGTTGEGTTNYIMIGSLCETINTYAGKDIFMTPIAYTTSLMGLKGFDQKEVDSMYINSPMLEQLINKAGVFSPETYKWSTPYTQMMWYNFADGFFLIRKEDEDKIKSWSDLANRPVFPQRRGTAWYSNMEDMLGPGGLNIWDTLDIKTFDLSHCADALKLKQVDAVIGYSAGGALAGFVQETLSRTDSVILAPTPEEIEKIVKGISYASAVTMTPESYGQDVGLTKTVKMPCVPNVYLVSPDVPEEIVYQVIKTAFENATEMVKVAAQWRLFAGDPWGLNLPYLMKYKKMGVPIHPGALRYFRELGHNTKLLGLE